MHSDDHHADTSGGVDPDETVDATPTPAGGAAQPVAGPHDDPDHVGPYRLVEKIGEGGMGEVWRAEQRTPIRRTVAVKIIKRGMDSKEFVARFAAERQALALMNHPNVAKVFDAGVTGRGRPFFAMEYVAGTPIDDYCDRNRLTTRERLELFAAVCEGVQHAHQKAIIHRDLKPGNVLVTEVDGRRVPKIIDFGVAKAVANPLTDSTVFTQLGVLVGTPAYMSPEQADLGGEDVDTRTDVYSLGVLLYKLLAGALPFDLRELRRAGVDAIRRTIREQEPPKPSTRLLSLGEESTVAARARRADPPGLRRQLQGDLDWITMKALEKDRTRRYASPLDLAEDIRRHLDDRPVEAGPPSAAYRLRKLVRRHRVAVAAAAAVLLALVLGVAGTTWGLVRALRAERLAVAEAEEARRQEEIASAVNAFLTDDLLAAVAPSAASGRGIDVRMREVLDAAAASLDRESRGGGRFADKPLVEAGIRATLGNTYVALGEYDLARPQLEREVELRRRAQGEHHWRTSWAVQDLAFAHFRKGDLEKAEAGLLRALEFEPHATGDQLLDVSGWKTSLALVYEGQARFDEAEALLTEALAYQRDAAGPEHAKTLRTMGCLANLYQVTDREPESEAINRELLDIRTRTLGPDHPTTLGVLNNLANVVASQGRLEEARAVMVEVLETKRRILGPEHSHTLNSMNNLGEVSEMLGDWEQARRWHRDTYDLRLRVLGPDSPRTLQSLTRLALSTARTGDPAAAEPLIRRSVARNSAVLGELHPETVEAERVYGLVLLDLARPREAVSVLRGVVDGLVASGEAPDTVCRGRVHLGLALAATGAREAAAAQWEACAEDLWMREAESAAAAEEVASRLEAWDAADAGRAWGELAVRYRAALTARP